MFPQEEKYYCKAWCSTPFSEKKKNHFSAGSPRSMTSEVELNLLCSRAFDYLGKIYPGQDWRMLQQHLLCWISLSLIFFVWKTGVCRQTKNHFFCLKKKIKLKIWKWKNSRPDLLHCFTPKAKLDRAWWILYAFRCFVLADRKMATRMETTNVKQESSMDKQTILAVLQFLKKNNLKVSAKSYIRYVTQLLFFPDSIWSSYIIARISGLSRLSFANLLVLLLAAQDFKCLQHVSVQCKWPLCPTLDKFRMQPKTSKFKGSRAKSECGVDSAHEHWFLEPEAWNEW